MFPSVPMPGADVVWRSDAAPMAVRPVYGVNNIRCDMRQSAVIQRNWQSLIKPEKLEVEPGADPARTATIIAEPLERGFGMTLGNAIRRILLSSLQGAAVTAVQIDGVLHEFSSIAGVREDVTDIVLNIKQLALRMHGEGPKRMTLSAVGPGEVKAGPDPGRT